MRVSAASNPYPDVQVYSFSPPPVSTIRAIPGLEGLSDLVEQHARAMELVEGARDSYVACLPGGDAFRAAAADAKKAEAVLRRAPQRYAEWSAAAAAADELAVAAAKYKDDGLAAGEALLRLTALDGYLCSLPSSWADDPASSISRAESRLEADRLRIGMWQARRVADWLSGPSRIGFALGNQDRASTSSSSPTAWPLLDLSPQALERLNALLGTTWSLTRKAEMVGA